MNKTMAHNFGKEMLENQVQQLSMENSTLKLENKMIKDKCNKTAAYISALEIKLQESQNEIDILQTKIEENSIQLKLTLQADMEREIEQQRQKAARSAGEVDVLKSQISFMEEQLGALRKECESLRHSMGKSNIHDAHMKEITTLQEEIDNLKHLLEESEQACTKESTRCKDLTEQVQSLTEIQELYQQQIEESKSGGSPAEKQIASLQVRLKLTEERLTQERADRATNLSQIEEKLLSENAKLQTNAKELDRLFKREREKARMFEQRANELRDENLQLRLAQPDEDEKKFSFPNSRHSKKNKDSQLSPCGIEKIWKQVEIEEDFICTPGDKDCLVLYLWRRYKTQQQTLNEWQLFIKHLELPMGDNNSINFQDALAMKIESEARMQQMEEKFEDISAEKISAEQIYKQQLTDLVKEKHESIARLKTFEDLMDALRAENESLRQGLTTTSDSLMGNVSERDTVESSLLDTLRTEISTLESGNSQLMRKIKTFESEINILRCQLMSRDKELTETFAELKSAQVIPKSSPVEDQLSLQRIQSLISEVTSLKEDLHLQSDRYTFCQTEKSKVETELREVKDELRAVRKQTREQGLETCFTQKGQAEKLVAEIEKKDEELLQLTTKLNDCQTALFSTKSELIIQQKIHQEMQIQVESLKDQLDDRCQFFDNLNAKDNEQMGQLEIANEKISSLNQELVHKQGECEILQLELQQAQTKISKMDEQNNRLTAQIKEPNFPEGRPSKSTPIATDLRISEMKVENDKLDAQLMQTTKALTTLKEEYEILNAEVIKIKQEKSTAVADVTKITNENSVLERRLKTLENENAMVKEERDALNVNTVRLETSLQEVLKKIESEIEAKLNGHCAEYSDKSEEVQMIIKELHAVQLKMFTKDEENNLLLNKIKRQEQGFMILERKCEFLQEENNHNRKDISRVTDGLIVKMRENIAAVEMNRMLLKEQKTLQKQTEQRETQLLHEKEITEHRKAEINEIINKIEHTEQVNLATSLTLQQKDSIIGDQEVKLRQLSQDLIQISVERDSLMTKVDNLTESLRSLSNVNSGLEQKLDAKESLIKDEQSVINKQKEEILMLNHRLDILKHEESLMLNNIASERKAQDKFKENIKSHEEVIQQLNNKIADLTKELELHKGQIVATVETTRQVKAEKETIMKDYQDICRRLGEKETILLDLQKQKTEEVSEVKQEAMRQMQAVNLERVTVNQDLGQLKSENNDLKVQLEKKDEQISILGETLKELDDAKRKIISLESYTNEQNKIATETKILFESLRKELFSSRDKNDELHDTIARKEVVIIDLKDKLRHCDESTEMQVTELRHTIEGMRSHHEYEKKSLRETHNKVEESLKLSNQEIRALKEANDHLTEQVNKLEVLLRESSYKLNQEETIRKQAEAKQNKLQNTVDDIAKKKSAMEENVNKLQMSINKTEAEQTITVERCRHLMSQLKSVQMALSASEGVVKDREEKIDKLKLDIIKHQQLLENHRHESTSTIHKLDIELKQQVESKEKDQTKLNHQAHQLSVDLEQAREVILIKNKENLQLQERVLELENRVREGETILKHTESSLKQEEEMQSKLINRFEEQESELKKLRNFLSKKADENGDGKEMWQEINHVLSEMSQQFQFHMESSKDSNEQISKLRRSLLEVEARLNTERALHAVTKSSMQALDEDCTRLRQAISAIRRRGMQTEKKRKSCMEEINAIIARSQTRAQVLMASGEFNLDGSLRNLTPSRDYAIGDTSFSPDTSFASDTSYAAHLANLSFLNLSGNFDAVSPQK